MRPAHTGKWNNDQANYPCRFPADYTLANHVDHPNTVCLRQADVIGKLDTLARPGLRPATLDTTLTQLTDQAAAAGAEDISIRAEAARAQIAVLNRKIAQYRASLDAGA